MLEIDGSIFRIGNLINYDFRIGGAKNRDDNNSSSISAPYNGSASDNDDADNYVASSPHQLVPLNDQSNHTKNDLKVARKSGYLKKQGGKIKTWHERWFILTGDELNYYKDADGKYLVSSKFINK